MNVSEVFGPTFQGEGPHTGQRVGFVRLAGCNLSCSWCDTPYSWDWERFNRKDEVQRWQVGDIANAIVQMHVSRIVVTGGEPMLQQDVIVDLWRTLGYRIDVETNGTVVPHQDTVTAVDLFCVSPKLAHGGDSKERRINVDALHAYAALAESGYAFFKFVAQDVNDLDEVQRLVDELKLPPHAVWCMGEGATIERHLATTQAIADAVCERGWNLSTRLHVLAWEQERGR